jgi:hypothetical protein
MWKRVKYVGGSETGYGDVKKIMKKQHRTTILALAFLASPFVFQLICCLTVYRVSPGMTRTEVDGILGRPRLLQDISDRPFVRNSIASRSCLVGALGPYASACVYGIGPFYLEHIALYDSQDRVICVASWSSDAEFPDYDELNTTQPAGSTQPAQ